MEYGRHSQLAFPSMTPAVKVLLLVNAAVFVANLILGGVLSEWFSVSWPQLWEGYGLGVLRLVTYQFTHSYFSLFHALLNMLVLYCFGTMVEGEVGRRGLYRLYLWSGVAGALLQMILGAILGSSAPTVGASGACYGIMVYAACMAPRARVIFIVFPIEMRWLVGILVLGGIYPTLLQLRGHVGEDGVAHGAHLGGALCGFLAFRFFRTRFMTADYRQGAWSGLGTKLNRWRARRRQEAARERQAQLDTVLEKIGREGMNSLTAAERRFLERASQEAKKR
jgi:membrane associated rhomboid family serine protease